ncbi:MAG: O-acetyl-ADP-ribose deacetylase [Lachnospiraceae bacterium]|jgi:O-acetyl-ADP-ribose deacetylase (regulator of RNase III)|nr:O-acetyl-ADP-ribose deacetylase [Lachnospiraceae bacterium]
MLEIVLGDITKVHADAIVNAANTSLLGGGGVDGAIHRAAGPELLQECRELHGCKTGQAKLTKGYRLPAKFVIHTPGPVWNGGSKGEAELLKSCYVNCLKLVVEHDLRTVAFPSISTGIYRFPLEKASEIAVETILDFCREHQELKVQMVCFDERTKSYYEEAVKKVNFA